MAMRPFDPGQLDEAQQATFLRLCAYYLLEARRKGEPLDPVARFHLGNGAALERVNWAADTSRRGIEQSAGTMVNLRSIGSKTSRRNHELYFAEGEIVASSRVRKLARYA